MRRALLLAAAGAACVAGIVLATRHDTPSPDGAGPPDYGSPADSDAGQVEPPHDAGQGPPVRLQPASPPSGTDPSREGDDPGLVFDGYQFTTLQQIVDAAGIDRDYAEWARARGQPEFSQYGVQGYADLPEATLRTMAEQGDRIAFFYLTSRLRGDRPMEAIDLLRQEADDGSAYAIDLMARQMRNMATSLEQGRVDAWAEDQLAGIRQIGEDAAALRTEAMAWTLVEEVYSGRTRGELVATLFETPPGSLPVEFGSACDRAAELVGELRLTWETRGVEEPPTGPPPLAHGSPAPRSDYLSACPTESLPTPDLGDCRPFTVSFPDGFPGDLDMYACPEGPDGT